MIVRFKIILLGKSNLTNQLRFKLRWEVRLIKHRAYYVTVYCALIRESQTVDSVTHVSRT